MRKIIFILLISIALTGCSSSNSSGAVNVKKEVAKEIAKKSKQVGEILIDYMQNGKQIDDSDQRIIDAYISKYADKTSSFNEYEQVVIQNILDMNSEVYYYKTYEKDSDKLKAMDRFNEDVDDYKQITDLLK